MFTTPKSSATQQPHSDVLRLSQKAPQYLEKQAVDGSAILLPFISAPKSSEVWNTYEQLLISCLRTGDDQSAHMCLERLIKRFGATNERVMGLRGLYQEAVAEDDAALENILKEYENALVEDPANTPIIKRRATLLRSLSRPADAIAALVDLLGSSPTDIEAWAELSDLYLAQGLLSQASFCLEEIILVAPNGWNIHARLGEMSYLSSCGTGNANEISTEKLLVESVHRFCRSIELCDGYLRGYYGLKLATDRLLNVMLRNPSNPESTSKLSTDSGESLHLPRATVQALNQKATSQIADIVKRSSAGDADYGGYDASEIISAIELLDRGSSIKQQ